MPDTCEASLNRLLTEIRACRICRDRPIARPLPHEPRPVLQVAATAHILIAGQAPGTRVQASGRPFTDPSGDRLRRWLGMASEIFYDENRVAILPMGFCFPGLDSKGGDLPPRPECAPAWRARLMAELPALKLIVTLGLPAARWHLGPASPKALGEILATWRQNLGLAPPVVALPHPSWRNNAMLRKHPWIEAEVVPALQHLVRQALM